MQTNQILGLTDLNETDFSNTLDKLSRKVGRKKAEVYQKKTKAQKIPFKPAHGLSAALAKDKASKALKKEEDIKEEEPTNSFPDGRKRKAPLPLGTTAEKKPKDTFDFGTTNPGEKPNWKALKAERKQIKEVRKMKKNTDVYQLSKEAKLMWEELRQEACPADKRIKLSKTLYDLLQPHIKKLVYAHDIVRVIECLVAVGGKDIRNKIFEDLKEQLLELTESKYGHFFVTKMLKYGTKDHKAVIIKSLEGKVVKLLKRPVAATVVEYAYNDHANAPQRARLIQEFYGPEFRHFKEEKLTTLGAVLAKFPEKKEIIMRNLRENLINVVSKSPWRLTIVHTLLWEYMSQCDPESLTEFIDLLKGELINILHTKDGSRVSMMCLWHGTPKDRKAIVKSFKTHVSKIAKEEHGNMVLMAMFDSVDDTTLVSKAILQELMEDVVDLMGNQYGRRVITYIVAPRNTVHFHPQFCEILARGDGNKHSKKDTEIRRKELLESIQDELVGCVARNFDTFMANNQITITLKAILNACDVPKLQSVFAIIQEKSYTSEPKDFIDSPPIFKLLKALIQKDSERKSVRLSDILLDDISSGIVEKWLTNHQGCTMFALMLDTMIPEIVEKVKNLLKTKKCKQILAKQETFGGKSLREKLNAI